MINRLIKTISRSTLSIFSWEAGLVKIHSSVREIELNLLALFTKRGINADFRIDDGNSPLRRTTLAADFLTNELKLLYLY